ncbi:MAG TPA: DUF481 domain-containing protein [Deltaproteobacteria bacterium]|nr:DUF481 domain-containing protein [Deltaproteobacteria bacterium]
MTRKMVCFFTAAALVTCAGLAGALDKPAEKSISDEAELSYVKTGGNTDTETLLLKNGLTYRPSATVTGKWKVAVLEGESSGVRTAQRYSSELRVDKEYTDRLYTFGNGQWLKDKFMGLDSRYILGGGGGYTIVSTHSHKLLAEAGLSYTWDDYTDNTSKEYAGGRLYGKYVYALDKKTRFSQWVEWLPDFEETKNYNLNAETAVTTSLSDVLSLKVSYLVNYDNVPVAGAEKTDTTFATTLVMNY